MASGMFFWTHIYRNMESESNKDRITDFLCASSFAVVTHYFPHPGSPDPTKKPSGPAQKAYHFLEYIIRAISDLQILLALALAISFVVVGICEKLQYQVTIGVNLLLMTCANYLLTLGLVRHHWRSKIAGLAALLRLLAVAGIYFLLGWILSLQNDWRKRPHAAEYMPDKSRNSSAILLKAACFLDPAFQNTTLSQNTTTIPGQRNNDFGIGDNHGLAPEWIFGIFLAIVTTLVLTVRLLGSFTRLGRLDSDKAGMPTYMKFLKNKLIQKGYWWLIWVLSVVVYGYSAYTISGLRSWVSQSGWLKSGERGNPEDRVSGFGQIAALVLMVAVVIAALDNAALSGKRTGKQKDLNAKPKKGKHGRSWV